MSNFIVEVTETETNVDVLEVSGAVQTPFTLGGVSVTVSGAELNYSVGVTSAIQTQLGLKAPLISPSFTTPTLGVATATSINKLTITVPATGSTLTIAEGQTLTVTTGGTLGTAAYTAAGAYEIAGATSSHASITTGIHGLAITAGQTLTVTTGGTLGTGAYATIANYAPLASPAFTTLISIDADAILVRDAANTLALRNAANAQSLKIYTSYTDASNYERFSIGTAAGTITLAAQTLGTGTDNIDIVINPAGTGKVGIGKTPGTNNILDISIPTAGGIMLDSADSVGYIKLTEAAGIGTRFYPSIILWCSGGSGVNSALTTYVDDDTGSLPAFIFDSRLNGAILVNRPIFSISTYLVEKFNVQANGNIRTYSGYGSYGTIANKTELCVTAAAATELTAADFIPAGAIPVAISTYVETSIAGGAATGYTVGDGADADRWGSVTGTAVGTHTDNADWVATTVQAFVAAQAITLTALTGNFPANGKIRVCMTYISGSPPTS